MSALEQAAKASFSSSASCCMENWKLYHRTYTMSFAAISSSLSTLKVLGASRQEKGMKAGGAEKAGERGSPI